MLCYDCHAEKGVETQASAVCSLCGAGLCVDHAVEGFVEETARASLGNSVTRRVHGRRMFCRHCVPVHMTTNRRIAG